MRVARPVVALSAALFVVVGGCSGGSNAAAEELFVACEGPGGDLLRLDGSSVLVEVLGDDARALAEGGGTSAEDIAAGDIPDLGVAFSVISGMECLVEATGYPGSMDQLRDGEEWGGWTFTITPGAGNEETSAFIAGGGAEVRAPETDPQSQVTPTLAEVPMLTAEQASSRLGCSHLYGENDQSHVSFAWTEWACSEFEGRYTILVEFADLGERADWVEYWEAKGNADTRLTYALSSPDLWGVWGTDPEVKERALALGATTIE